MREPFKHIEKVPIQEPIGDQVRMFLHIFCNCIDIRAVDFSIWPGLEQKPLWGLS